MSEIDNGIWRIIGISVRGANHVRQGSLNQDCIGWTAREPGTHETSIDVPFVISLADGHGSERYFRSNIGARLAVQIANEVLYQFAQGLTHSPLSRIEVDAGRLPLQILAQWRRHVAADWEVSRWNEREEEWLDAHPGTREAIIANPTIPYGTTLVSALVTEHFILYCQIGDGNILTVASDGTYAEPVPADERNFANEAMSLCNATVGDFQIHLQPLEANPPAMILLATDGYVNSFVEKQGFYKVATDIWHIIQTNGEDGLRTVANNLESWLERSTRLGSGDDISVGILWRMSAFQEQIQEAEVNSPPVDTLLPPPTIPGVALSNIDDDEPTLPTTTSLAGS